MKKKEIGIIAVIAVIAIAVIAYMKLSQPKGSGVVVAIQHRNEIVMTFDPAVDAVYHIEGDYTDADGHNGVDVEVKDGKWRVTNEACPNHICAQMGWADTTTLLPITCLPNNIMVFVQEMPE